MQEDEFRRRLNHVIQVVDPDMKDAMVEDMFVNVMTLLANVQRETGQPVNVEVWGW